MITGKDFRKVIVYLYNVSYEEFTRDILNKEFSDCIIDTIPYIE